MNITEKAMATHSSTLAWKIPWTEEPGRLQSMGSLSRTGLSDFTFTFHFPALEKEMATHSSVLAWRIRGMGEADGLLSMGSCGVGHDWSDLAAAVAWMLTIEGNKKGWVCVLFWGCTLGGNYISLPLSLTGSWTQLPNENRGQQVQSLGFP